MTNKSALGLHRDKLGNIVILVDGQPMLELPPLTAMKVADFILLNTEHQLKAAAKALNIAAESDIAKAAIAVERTKE